MPSKSPSQYIRRRQGGRVVRVLDFQSVGPGFESHSEHFMDLFHGSPELCKALRDVVISAI